MRQGLPLCRVRCPGAVAQAVNRQRVPLALGDDDSDFDKDGCDVEHGRLRKPNDGCALWQVPPQYLCHQSLTLKENKYVKEAPDIN